MGFKNLYYLRDKEGIGFAFETVAFLLFNLRKCRPSHEIACGDVKQSRRVNKVEGGVG